MIANHIHDALAQVRKLQEFILERQTFRGYSGRARIGGGLVALGGAAILGTAGVPSTPGAHLIGWGMVLLISLALNYGGLAVWFCCRLGARTDPVHLMPAVDAIPALAVGALLSLAMILRQDYDLLFGIWMTMYGIVHVMYRQSLPGANYAVGLFYIACGAFCLLDPSISFVNPWPMGLVFFVGE